MVSKRPRFSSPGWASGLTAAHTEGTTMQIKKNPRDSQPGEGSESYDDEAETGLNAVPAFIDEPQRPAWRRDSAFATTPVVSTEAPFI